MTSCPVCEFEITDKDTKTCPQCGWDKINRYYLNLTPEEKQRLRAELEQAQAAWREQRVVYSPDTPVPEFVRDPFELPEEFRERIARTAWRPIPAGEATLIKEQYDIHSGRFPLEVE